MYLPSPARPLSTFHIPGCEHVPAGGPGLCGAALWHACPPPARLCSRECLRAGFALDVLVCSLPCWKWGPWKSLGGAGRGNRAAFQLCPGLVFRLQLLDFVRQIPRIANNQTHPYLHLSAKALSKQEIEVPFCLAAWGPRSLFSSFMQIMRNWPTWV